MSEVISPKEIENAVKNMPTAHVSDDGKRMVLVLRPPNSSRVFQMLASIEEVREL